MLSYSIPAYCVGETLGVSNTSDMIFLRRFCEVIIDKFESKYFRNPTDDDIAGILTSSKSVAFLRWWAALIAANGSGIIPDCVLWTLQGKREDAYSHLEAVVDQSILVWHAFSEMPNCLNIINVVKASPVS